MDEFLPKYTDVTADTVMDILHKEIGNVFREPSGCSCVVMLLRSTRSSSNLPSLFGNVFMEVLEDSGVYKRNEEGQAAFDRFIAALNE